MNQIRIGKAKNQGKPGDTIAVEINGKTVQKKAGNEINSTKVLVVGDTVLSGSSPVEKRSQSNIKRKRKKKKSVTATYPVKILAVVENDEEEVYEFWLYGDRKAPKKIYELNYYNQEVINEGTPVNEMTGRYLYNATINNSGKKENDWEVFIKWYDYDLPVNPPQEILDIDPTVEGWLGGYQAILISNNKQVPITQYVDYLRQVGDRLTIFPDDYISPFTGSIYNDFGFDAVRSENKNILHEWPKHGDSIVDGPIDLWVINDLESQTKLIQPPPDDFSLEFEPLLMEEILALLNPISKGSDFISTIQSPAISSFEIEAIAGMLATARSPGPYTYFTWQANDGRASIHDIVGSFYQAWSDLYFFRPFKDIPPEDIDPPAHSIQAINTDSLYLGTPYPLRQERLNSRLYIPLVDPRPPRNGGGNGFSQDFATSQYQNNYLGIILFDIENLEPINLDLAIASSFMNVRFSRYNDQVVSRYLFYKREFIDTTINFFGVNKTFFLNSLDYREGRSGIRFLHWSKIDIPFLLIKGENSFILGRWFGISYFDGDSVNTNAYEYSLCQIVEGEIIETAIADFSVLEKDGKLNLDQYFTLKGNTLYEVIYDNNLLKTLSSKSKVHVKQYVINDEGIIEDKGVKSHEALPLKKEAEIWSASFF